jgi:hypothetical protein
MAEIEWNVDNAGDIVYASYGPLIIQLFNCNRVGFPKAYSFTARYNEMIPSDPISLDEAKAAVPGEIRKVISALEGVLMTPPEVAFRTWEMDEIQKAKIEVLEELLADCGYDLRHYMQASQN